MSSDGPLILVIDPEPPIRRLLRTSLMAQRYRVVEAETAAEGIRCVRSGRPDTSSSTWACPTRTALA